MKRVWLVAQREFLSAVVNKGFIIGLLVMPAIIAILVVVMPRLMSTQGSQIRGEVAVIDPTGQVFDGLRAGLTPEAITRRRTEGARRALENAPAPVRAVANESSNEAIERTMGAAPAFTLLQRAATADVQGEKRWLTDTVAEDAPRHLALVVIHPDAITQDAAQAEYGGYDIYIPDNTDERVETTIFDAMRETLVAARVRARNMDRAQVEAVMRVRRAQSVTVTAGTERQTNVGFNRFLPFIFAGLLVFGIMIGGQTLLTQVIEEKSSRVVEVLLSAVSPLELMAGKILGQMAVSMLVLALYVVMGLLLLTSFAMLGLIEPMLIVYLIVFFLVGYLIFASVFAVGAAVNEMREAQSLMTPVMLALMAPWFFATPIGRDPDSAFSVAMSLIPPINTFAMMIRLASTTPPPLWQVGLSIVIGLASAVLAMWFAAKIFKVGLLMHGKPPNMATMIRWARQA